MPPGSPCRPGPVAVGAQEPAILQLDEIGRVANHWRGLGLRPALAVVVGPSCPDGVLRSLVSHGHHQPSRSRPHQGRFLKVALLPAGILDNGRQVLPGLSLIDCFQNDSRLIVNVTADIVCHYRHQHRSIGHLDGSVCWAFEVRKGHSPCIDVAGRRPGLPPSLEVMV